MADDEKPVDETAEEKPTDEKVDETPEDDKPIVDDGAEPEGNAPAKKTDKQDEGEDEDDAATFAEDRKNIVKVVREEMSQLTQDLQQQKIDSQLAKILVEHPEYKPYEARIRRFVNHPNRIDHIRQGLPVSSVVIEAISPVLEQIGASKKKLADEKARMTGTGGQAAATEEKNAIDWSKIPSNEMTKIAEQVKSGQYKPGK